MYKSLLVKALAKYITTYLYNTLHQGLHFYQEKHVHTVDSVHQQKHNIYKACGARNVHIHNTLNKAYINAQPIYSMHPVESTEHTHLCSWHTMFVYCMFDIKTVYCCFLALDCFYAAWPFLTRQLPVDFCGWHTHCEVRSSSFKAFENSSTVFRPLSFPPSGFTWFELVAVRNH